VSVHTILISADKPGRFNARLADSKVFLVESSSTPFCDSARALLSGGFARADDTLLVRHVGSHYAVLRGIVGDVAALDETGMGLHNVAANREAS
jgi:hypothetical protein